MTVGSGLTVADGKLTVKGKTVLVDVKDNIFVTQLADGGALADGAFLGVTSDQMGSRRVFPLGKLS